jgi:hypothetical protein
VAANEGLLKSTRTTVDLEKQSKPAPSVAAGPDADTDSQSLPSEEEERLAVSFFVTHVLSLGRSPDASDGFLEVLNPTLAAAEAPDSTLRTVLRAVAAQFWASWKTSSNQFHLHTPLLVRAYASLAESIASPQERAREATILAAILLQIYERYYALWNHDRVTHAHRNGAAALLRQQKLDGMSSTNRGYLVGWLLHTEVRVCLGEKRPLPVEEIVWLQGQDMASIPSNPSVVLDMIGVFVADHQHRFLRFSTPDGVAPSTVTVEGLESWFKDVQTVDEWLQSWLQIVPESWSPVELPMDAFPAGSVTAYSDVCLIYPNIQIASLWNIWRRLRFILLRIKFALVQAFLSLKERPVRSSANFAIHQAAVTPNYHEYVQGIHGLVDSICHSVPFFLGSLTEPCTASQLEEPGVVFPSYHVLETSTEAYKLYESGRHFMSQDNHRRHAVVQGPWNLLAALTQVLDLLGDEHSHYKPLHLQHGQASWIRAQYHRVLKILHLEHRKSVINTGQNPGRDNVGASSEGLSRMRAIERRIVEALTG